MHIVREQSKEESKGQESIQSSTTHYPGHGIVWEGNKKQNKKTSHTREPRGQPFPTGDHKAVRNRNDRQETLNPT